MHRSVLESIHELLESDYQGTPLASGNPGKKGSGAEVLGTCPLCGKPVHMGKYGGYCSGYKDAQHPCPFRFSETQYGKKLTAAQMKNLLAGKKILVRGLTSFRTKKKFDAFLRYAGKASEKGYAVLEKPDFENIPPKKQSKKQ